MEDQKMNLTVASVSLQLFTVRQHDLVPFQDTPRAHPTSWKMGLLKAITEGAL